MRSVAFANQKGGVGKTTTAVHMAHGLSLAGAKVALFDLDPQGNATVALQGLDHAGPLLAADGPLSLLRPVQPRLWMLGSPGADRTIDRAAKVDVSGLLGLSEQLATAGVDWLIVDCPPRMDDWGWAGLELCRQVLIPVQAEFFAMHGLSQMLATLEEAQKAFPGRAELLGVLATLLDFREGVAREVLQDLRRNLGPRVLGTVIFRDAQFVEAASHGKTLFTYNPSAKGALCYGELVREVLHG